MRNIPYKRTGPEGLKESYIHKYENRQLRRLQLRMSPSSHNNRKPTKGRPVQVIKLKKVVDKNVVFSGVTKTIRPDKNWLVGGVVSKHRQPFAGTDSRGRRFFSNGG